MDSIGQSLVKMKSYNALEGILAEGKLIKYQAVDVLSMLYRKKSIVMYDTGMGKTYLAAGIIRCLLNQDKNRKFLMIVKHKQLSSTPEKLRRAAGCNVLATAADEASVRKNVLSGEYKKYCVFMITNDCLNNNKVMSELFRSRNDYCAVIIDEAHNLNNSSGSSSAEMLSAICNGVEYCFALTATPIVSDKIQLARLACIVDPSKYKNPKRVANDLTTGRLTLHDDPFFFISRSRKDFGVSVEIHGYVLFVRPQKNQLAASGSDLFQICKGDGAENQVSRLVDFIKERNGKKGLVYINQHSIRRWVLPKLDEAGIRYACINGHTNADADKAVLMQFNNTNSLDIVITSITESIDLDCDWVLFYEFTLNIAQMIGRAYRGFSNKVLDVYFMITEGTGEMEYFINNVYRRAEVIQSIIGKKYDAVFDAYEKCKEYGGDFD